MSPPPDDQPQTRTTLPPADTADAPPRGRSVRAAASVVVVVGLLVGAIAYARSGGDGSGGSGSGSRNGAATRSAASGGPSDVSTTTNGHGAAANTPHSQAGARAAAENDVQQLGSARIFQQSTRERTVADVAAPTARAALLHRLDSRMPALLASLGLDADGRPPGGLALVCRTIPAGTKVTAYSDSAATVQVWNDGLLGLAGVGSTHPVAESWNTTTVKLSWVSGRWGMTDYAQTAGPVPVTGEQPASGASAIAGTTRSFEEPRYAP